jgi:hypothetical protein
MQGLRVVSKLLTAIISNCFDEHLLFVVVGPLLASFPCACFYFFFCLLTAIISNTVIL